MVILFVVAARVERPAGIPVRAHGRWTASLRLGSVTPTPACLLVDGILERGDPFTLALEREGVAGGDLAELRSWSDDNAVVDVRVDPQTWIAHLHRGHDVLHVPLAGVAS